MSWRFMRLEVLQLSKKKYSNGSKGCVGFIGLGNMGASMAANLAKSGYQIVFYDVSDNSINSFKNSLSSEAKISRVNNPRAVCEFSGVKHVVTMLPSSKEIRQVYSCQKTGLLSIGNLENLIFLDCSTAEPSICKEMSVLADSKRAIYLDCPVSGGVLGAAKATLTFMVGGSAKGLEKAQPLLSCMGQKVIHCGEQVGSGQAAKICNNMLLAICMMGTSEAMALGQHLNLSPEVLASVINVSSGQCWSSKMYNPVPGVVEGVPANRDYEGGFASALMLKDLGLAMSAANETNSVVTLGSQALQSYRLLVEKGFGKKDFSFVYKFFYSKL